ncbi:MAG: cytochrome c [Ectothiorhodospiraceae bacterium]|nr:cytochrome c [Ectothiorhodospiraceae bacterium]MCH8506595.1 cytochrome c [Ectothiorhodospiraceae bacterium]
MMKQGFAAPFVLVLGLGLGVAVSAHAGDVERGKAAANSCIACHGPGGNSHIPAMFPSIAGRDAGELEALLRAYRDGDIQSPQMTPQAVHLSDQDIADLAAYFAAQEAK